MNEFLNLFYEKLSLNSVCDYCFKKLTVKNIENIENKLMKCDYCNKKSNVLKKFYFFKKHCKIKLNSLLKLILMMIQFKPNKTIKEDLFFYFNLVH